MSQPRTRIAQGVVGGVERGEIDFAIFFGARDVGMMRCGERVEFFFQRIRVEPRAARLIENCEAIHFYLPRRSRRKQPRI